MSLVHDPAAISAYALDALPRNERVLVENHLYTCDRCLGQLDTHLEVIAGLVPDRPPPADVWSRVAAQIDHAESPSGVGEDQPGPRLLPKITWFAAAAAVIVVAIWGGATLGRSPALTDESIVAAAASAAREPGTVVADFVVGESSVAEVVLSADGHGFVIPNPSLATLPSDRTYQLWVITGDEQVISGGLLGPVPAPTTFTWHGEVSGFALTREVAGGVVESQGDVVAVIQGL